MYHDHTQYFGEDVIVDGKVIIMNPIKSILKAVLAMLEGNTVILVCNDPDGAQLRAIKVIDSFTRPFDVNINTRRNELKLSIEGYEGEIYFTRNAELTKKLGTKCTQLKVMTL